ncbi:MAG: S49 family peptidase [Bacteroidetes bacterium]|nr:S49 family peptidase [Bacteroidota bacterium]
MPNWKEVLEEIAKINRQGNSALDVVRRKYLKAINSYTKRNIIAYYSGWLQRPNVQDAAVNDKDISGFMLNIHKLDRSKGLDLILHTPGGDLAATEALVVYLKSMFDKDIRAIVPQLSMSAGTMIALSCKEILMGKHSSLGPIDPQMGNMPCQAIIDEFDRARNEILNNPANAALWQFIISKYHPTLLSACQHAITMSRDLVEGWLNDNMCNGDKTKTKSILDHFSSHINSKTHARHLSMNTCKKHGVKVVDLELDNKLQDLVLTTHHAFMHTFSNSGAVKIIENHRGVAYIEHLPSQL